MKTDDLFSLFFFKSLHKAGYSVQNFFESFNDAMKTDDLFSLFLSISLHKAGYSVQKKLSYFINGIGLLENC